MCSSILTQHNNNEKWFLKIHPIRSNYVSNRQNNLNWKRWSRGCFFFFNPFCHTTMNLFFMKIPWKCVEKRMNPLFMAMKAKISDFVVLTWVMTFPRNSSLVILFMNHEKCTKPWIKIFKGHESHIYFRLIHFMTAAK